MSLLLLHLLAPASLAADGFDAHGFNLAAFDGNIRSPLSLQRPSRFYGGQFYVGGLLEYASRPLTLATRYGDDVSYDPVLDHVFGLNLSAGFAPFSRLRVNVAAPIYFTSTGRDGEPQGADFGDLRLDLMGVLVRPAESGGFGLGLVPYVDLPTGNPEHFLGQNGFSGGAKLAATGEIQRLTVGGELGVQLEPARDLLNLQRGNNLSLGLSGGWAFTDHLGLNLEGHVSLPLQANEVAGADTPSEVLLSLRGNSKSGVHWTAGGAAGVVRGASAARYRVFLGGGWGRPHKVAPVVVDRDGDGLLDAVDSCPDRAEDMDGVRDEDGCPDEAASLEVVVQRDGAPVSGALLTVYGGAEPQSATSEKDKPYRLSDLPPGSDYRAVAVRSACLTGEASTTLVEGENRINVPLNRIDGSVRVLVMDSVGQPLPGAIVTWERDGTGCIPTEPLKLPAEGVGTQAVGIGKHTIFVTVPQYNTFSQEVTIQEGKEVPVEVRLAPTKVKLEQEQILILEMVYFDFDSDNIQERSFTLLDEVAATLRSHPELSSVEIQGHTDDRGSDTYNQSLSQRRVDAVLRYLVGKGVAAERLVAKGYGEAQPTVPNTTEANRAKNRRVEFKILKQEAASGD